MEGTIGEIRLFASNFAPKTWAFCQGQTLAISTNTALFSILGTTYGGNGQTTFMLPDLRSRSAVGTGQGPGLTNYPLGAVTGTENVTLLVNQIPAHNHLANVTAGTGGGATVLLNGVSAAGTQPSPGGGLLAQSSTGANNYVSSGTLVAMKAGSMVVSDITAPLPSVIVGNTGGSMPHNNIQPVTGLYYIICLYGIFPSRN